MLNIRGHATRESGLDLAKEPEDEVIIQKSRHSRETHLRRMGSNERRQRAHNLTYVNDVPPDPRRHGNLHR
jgi:hypothetical protein